MEEAIVIGNTYDIQKFDGAKNRRDLVSIKIVDVVKKVGKIAKVVYTLKGKRTSVSIKVFKKLINWASKAYETNEAAPLKVTPISKAKAMDIMKVSKELDKIKKLYVNRDASKSGLISVGVIRLLIPQFKAAVAKSKILAAAIDNSDAKIRAVTIFNFKIW